MTDREKVIKRLEKCKRCECDDCAEKGASKAPWDCPAYDDFVDSAIALLKEQDNEVKRIMKVVWDTLHEGLSIDTVPDQDWVYELIRHRIEDRYNK